MLIFATVFLLILGLAALLFSARVCCLSEVPSRIEPLQAFCLGLSFLFIGLPFVLYSAAQVGFVLKLDISQKLLFLGIAGSVLLFWFLLRRDLSQTWRFFSIGLFLCLFFFGLWLGGVFFDASYDGKAYQQEAVLAFLGGLNPLTQSYPSNHWVNDYPKLPWILAAALAQWTPSLQNAKGFHTLFLCASFFGLLRLFLNQGACKPWAVLSAGLLACNPVVIYQFFTFYVDGPLYGLLAAFLSEMIILVRARCRAHAADVVLATMSGALLVNLKFTGLVYAGVILFLLCIFCFIYAKRSYFLRVICLCLAILCLGLGLGASPYLKNILQGRHVFHPLMGAHKSQSIITAFKPVYMVDKNPLINILVSNFSQSKIVEREATATFKNPFDLLGRVEEFEMLTVPDPRVGGFGPYMGAILVLSGCLFGLILIQPRSVLVPSCGKYAILLAAGILGSTLINPEAWWARYAPQFWMSWSPLLLWLRPSAMGYKLLARALAWGIVLICCLTVMLTAYFILNKQYLLTLTIRENLKLARCFKEPAVYLLANHFALSTDRLLRENGFIGLPYSDVLPKKTGYLLFFYVDHGFLLFDRAREEK